MNSEELGNRHVFEQTELVTSLLIFVSYFSQAERYFFQHWDKFIGNERIDVLSKKLHFSQIKIMIIGEAIMEKLETWSKRNCMFVGALTQEGKKHKNRHKELILETLKKIREDMQRPSIDNIIKDLFVIPNKPIEAIINDVVNDKKFRN